MITSWQTLGGARAGLTVQQYDVGLRPGTDPNAYSRALNHALFPRYFASATTGDSFYQALTALIGTLTLLIALAAGLGVLNTVVLGTRDRVHDLGVFKAVGMTPRQTIAMVICWIAGAALIAGVIAVPVSMILHSSVVRAMASAAGTGLPASYISVFSPAELLPLALAGLVIGVAGALLPASWAARARTASTHPLPSAPSPQPRSQTQRAACSVPQLCPTMPVQPERSTSLPSTARLPRASRSGTGEVALVRGSGVR